MPWNTSYLQHLFFRICVEMYPCDIKKNDSISFLFGM